MARRMSCSLTVDAVRAQTKTVTRRAAATWATLTPGDRLVLVEKAMGLPKGTKQVVLAEVEVVDVRLEQLIRIASEGMTGTRAEGLGHMTPRQFIRFWCDSHGVPRNGGALIEVRRIEWRYLQR